MSSEKAVISSTQLAFMLGGFIYGSNVLVAATSNITKQDTWIAFILGYLASLLFAWIYVSLAQKFPGKTLVEILELIYGILLGKFISIFYLVYFLTIVSMDLRYVADFFVTFIMPETPLVVFLIMLAFACAWAVNEGIEVIARSSFIVTCISLGLIIFLTFAILKEVKLENLAPFLEVKPFDLLHGTHIIAAIPFGETIVFLSVIGYLNKIKQAGKTVFTTLSIMCLLLVILSLRNTSVLGSMHQIFTLPVFEVARLLNLGKIFTRLEVVILIALMVSMFIKISIVYYAVTSGIAKLFGLKSYTPLVVPVGIIIICLAKNSIKFELELVYFDASIYPVFSFPFQFIIPLMSLVIMKIRKLA